MSNGPSVNAPFGLSLPVHDIRVTNRTGSTVARGRLMQLDFVSLGSEATSNTEGIELSGLANGIAVTADAMAGLQIVVVALSDIADDANGMCRVYGRVKAMGSATVDISSAGAALTVTASELGGHASDGKGIYAIALEDTADDTLSEVLWNGFGWANASA